MCHKHTIPRTRAESSRSSTQEFWAAAVPTAVYLRKHGMAKKKEMKQLDVMHIFMFNLIQRQESAFCWSMAKKQRGIDCTIQLDRKLYTAGMLDSMRTRRKVKQLKPVMQIITLCYLIMRKTLQRRILLLMKTQLSHSLKDQLDNNIN